MSSSPPTALSQREKRWGLVLLLTFIALVSLPYLWFSLLTPEGFTWGGLFFSADDQNVHLMWAKQAQMGSFFIRDLFTTEGLSSGDRPIFFNLFAFVIGLLSRSGIDAIFFYHTARVAFAGAFVWQLHKLLITATSGAPERENTRLGALALATLTTGGGFILVTARGLHLNLGVVFVDHPTSPGFPNMPEAFALLSALIYPLNIASFALLCFLLRALIENRGAVKAFFAALILSNIHTYDALPLLVTCVIAFGWGLIRREGIKSKLAVWSAIFVGLLIPVLYQALVFRGSEEFRVKAETPTSPPPIWQIAASFSPLLLLALWSWKAKWMSGTRKWLWVYAASLVILVYTPKSFNLLWQALFVPHPAYEKWYLFSFSRKMLEGLQIPLLVFAGAGLAALPARRIVAPLVIAVCAVSPIAFYAWTFENAAQNNNDRASRSLAPRYYLTNAEQGALLTLQKAPDKNVAVLCTPVIGSYVPRATGLYTFTGHWAETLNVRDKTREESRFYAGAMSPQEARDFLKRNHIRYVVESLFERAIARTENSASTALGLKKIYQANSVEGPVSVFEVE